MPVFFEIVGACVVVGIFLFGLHRLAQYLTRRAQLQKQRSDADGSQ